MGIGGAVLVDVDWSLHVLSDIEGENLRNLAGLVLLVFILFKLCFQAAFVADSHTL